VVRVVGVDSGVRAGVRAGIMASETSMKKSALRVVYSGKIKELL
jgi:hypothetical protein